MSTPALRANGIKFGANDTEVWVTAYGAVGDGVTDSTTAINNASAAAAGGVIHFPAGSYIYNGTGLTGTALKIAGDGKDSTVITLGSGKYLVDDNQRWNSFQMRGLRFENGAGAVRNRFTGINVNNYKEVDDCYFNNFTGAAISSNSSDDPYWKISRCIFMGANSTTTIGVALSGLSDADSITDCEFLEFKIGVKLMNGGNNVRIVNSSFLHFNAGTSRAAVWVVPNPTNDINGGQGLVIAHAKFGNENQDTTDYRILYADEGAGTYFGDRLFATSVSTGWISGHTVIASLVNGANATAQPLVYSYTPNIEGSIYGPLTVGGTRPTYIVQINTPPTVDVGSYNYNNIIGPIAWANTDIPGGINGWSASNAPSMFRVIDPAQSFTAADPNMMDPWTPGANSAGYANMLTTGVRSFTLAGGGTALANIADAAGGIDATEATIAATTGLVYAPLTATATVGVPMWIEFDMKSGSASPLTSVQLRMQDNSSNISFRRMITIPASTTIWKRYRFLYTPRAVPATFNVMFANLGAQGTVDIGQVRVYQAYEPVSGGQLNGLWNAGKSTLTGAATFGAGATFAGFTSYNGTASSVPASPWTAMTLLNSWVVFGASNATPSYFKDAAGIVHLKGIAKNGTAANAIIAQLPAGFRPALASICAGVSNGGLACQIQIDASGNINALVNGSTTYTGLDGISFLAEA